MGNTKTYDQWREELLGSMTEQEIQTICDFKFCDRFTEDIPSLKELYLMQVKLLLGDKPVTKENLTKLVDKLFYDAMHRKMQELGDS